MSRAMGLAVAVIIVAGSAAQAAPVKVVASFSVLGDIVHEVAGDHADVTVLVGPDGDAHTFDPSPADAKKLADAALVVANGLGLDGWLDKLAASAGYKGPQVTASAGIATRKMTEGEGAVAKQVTDPHAWQDLRNGVIFVRNIAAALEKADPADAAVFETNAATYTAKLVALDAGTRAKIGAVPQDKRRVITSHDAFGYFGAAYGVTFIAPEGLSTDQEASAASVAKLIDQIKAEKIKAIFIENMTDPRLIQSIAAETGVQLGGALFSDALSPPDGPAPTYTAMFDNNVPKLVAGMAKN